MQLEFRESAIKLAKHLDSILDEKKGYPDKPTWGYAFSYLLALELRPFEKLYNLESKALINYLNQEKPDKSFSWEFTVYAMQRAVSHHYSIIEGQKINKYREKGTRMVNWTLLRQLNRLNDGQAQVKPKLIISAIRKLFSTQEGLILDEWKTRSYQYHCFCLFVISEIYESYPSEFIKRWLLESCTFINNQALGSGCTLYIGRGQEQIFGYGALLFSLTYAEKKFGFNATSLPKVWSYLKSFQRKNGSMPLVLNKCQPEKENICYETDRPSGWYGYNTLYDYQPFLAYCLIRASKL